MKNAAQKSRFIVCNTLFAVSFAYPLLGAIFYLLRHTLPAGGFADFLDAVYWEESAVLPMVFSFALSVLVSVLVLVFFRKQFQPERLWICACPPVAMLLVYGVLRAVAALLETLGVSMSIFAENMLLQSVAFLLLGAYAVTFFVLMHRERRRLGCA